MRNYIGDHAKSITRATVVGIVVIVTATSVAGCQGTAVYLFEIPLSPGAKKREPPLESEIMPWHEFYER